MVKVARRGIRLQVIRLQEMVVRMKKPDEQDQIGALQKRLAHLQQSLKKAQAENLINATYLDLACREMGQSTRSFKKESLAKVCPEISSTEPKRGHS